MRIVVFGHDAFEPTLRKRIAALAACGSDITGFTFHRARGAVSPAPLWRNIDLGETTDRAYARRLLKLARALIPVTAHLRAVADADVVYARNLDMALVALAALRLSRSRARFVYEVLDVQRIMMTPGAAGATARAVERLVLRATDLLVVSAPEFVTRYFAPVQGFQGPWHLLENKVPAAAANAFQRRTPEDGPPWTIGWSGVLRCRRSLDLLTRIAQAVPDRVRVDIRGRVSPADLSEDDFEAAARATRTLRYLGSYQAPADLPDVYGGVHLTWAVDYTDAGANSDWLIPNRIYEGGLFGAVAIARAGTATGALVERLGLGWTFPEPLDRSVSEFLATLTPALLAEKREHIARLPRSRFVDETDTADLLARLAGQNSRDSLVASVSRTM